MFCIPLIKLLHRRVEWDSELGPFGNEYVLVNRPLNMYCQWCGCRAVRSVLPVKETTVRYSKTLSTPPQVFFWRWYFPRSFLKNYLSPDETGRNVIYQRRRLWSKWYCLEESSVNVREGGALTLSSAPNLLLEKLVYSRHCCCCWFWCLSQQTVGLHKVNCDIIISQTLDSRTHMTLNPVWRTRRGKCVRGEKPKREKECSWKVSVNRTHQNHRLT